MQFKIWARTNGLDLPDRDEEILRNLQARELESKAAYDAMKFKHDYQRDHFPITIDEETAELMNQGLAYIYGRDMYFRPVVVLNALKLTQTKAQDRQLMDLIILLHSYMDEFMMVEGRIENFILLIDCKDISIFNAPYAMLKSILATAQGLFKCRARAIFFLNAPAAFSVLWRTLRFSLDEVTASKAQIVSKNTCDELKELVIPEQLQIQYGG